MQQSCILMEGASPVFLQSRGIPSLARYPVYPSSARWFLCCLLGTTTVPSMPSTLAPKGPPQTAVLRGINAIQPALKIAL
ncbi:hypothetical protein GJ744_012180 [Endocarpon pusillum]|uniref:Uncharacterized protein n=1 Tax=Endocarpon pusillum TaxID=364733 RepID=A0A8H7E2C7_9EURO|nr:hypothetical protein GJ744_012180 [Endocarpon pusillum]